MKIVTFIDLFAGLGGTRIGFELACKEKNLIPQCIFTSEIKTSAIKAYKMNFKEDKISGDITKINIDTIPDFDYLLGGFPCQPFSSAGNRKGFLDERGGLFFSIFHILKLKKPKGFLLENVEGLLNHNQGKTLKTILSSLESLGYNVACKLLDASNFGVPQKRKRVYIVGSYEIKPDLSDFILKEKKVKEVIDVDYVFEENKFSKQLLKSFSYQDLWGKNIKDKRGGQKNIHSRDIGLKGIVSEDQKKLLSLILKKRRNKVWAEKKGIKRMDGMPLTFDEIQTFYKSKSLKKDLDDLLKKGYLTLEHPKDEIIQDGIRKRVYKTNSEKGYNIVSGKLSFPLSHILDPEGFSPTIVATEVGKIGVATEKGVRSITIKEALGLSGFPDRYDLSELDYNEAFDLIGNTVMPPVIKEVALKLINK